MGNYNQKMVFCLQSRVNFGAACRALLGAAGASNSPSSSASCMKENNSRNKLMCGTFRLLLGVALDASPGPCCTQLCSGGRDVSLGKCARHAICARLRACSPRSRLCGWCWSTECPGAREHMDQRTKGKQAHQADVQPRCSVRISRPSQPKSIGSCSSAMQLLSGDVRENAPRLLHPARRLRCRLCAAAWPRGRPLPRPPPQSVPRHRSQIPRDPSAAVVPAINESLRKSQSVSDVG